MSATTSTSTSTTTLFAALQGLKLPIPSIPSGRHNSLSDVTERALGSIPQEMRFQRALYDPQLVQKLVDWLKDFLGDAPLSDAVARKMDEMKEPQQHHNIWEENNNEAEAKALLTSGVNKLVLAIMQALNLTGRLPAGTKIHQEEAFVGLKPDYTFSSQEDPPKRILLEAKHPVFMTDTGSQVDAMLRSAGRAGRGISWRLNLPLPSKLLLTSGVYMLLSGANWVFISSHNDWFAAHLESPPGAQSYLVVSPLISLTPTQQDVIIALVAATIMTMVNGSIEVASPDLTLSLLQELDGDDNEDEGNDEGDPTYEISSDSSDRNEGTLPPRTRSDPTGLLPPLSQTLSAAFIFPGIDSPRILKLKCVGAPINDLFRQASLPVKKPQLEIREEIGHGALAYVFKALFYGKPVIAKVAETTSSHDLWKQENLLGEYDRYLYLSDQDCGGSREHLVGGVVPECYGLYHKRGMHVLLLSDEGETLDSWSQLDSIPRTRVFDQLCTLHAAGLAHGDFEPRNVVFRENGELRIIDLDHASGHCCKDLKRLQGRRLNVKKWRCHELRDARIVLGLDPE